MRIMRDKELYAQIDRGSGATFADLRFERCLFDRCYLSLTTDVSKRSIVRNVQLVDCLVQNHSGIGSAILEDVLIENLRTKGLFILWDPLFKHVTLRGHIGQIKVNALVDPDVTILKRPDIQLPFSETKGRYYEQVDWALDIRDVQARMLEINGVPMHLIRRDFETQVIVKRSKALGSGWREQLDPENYWIDYLDGCVLGARDATGYVAEYLLVTPRGLPWKEFEKALSDLKELRKIGLVEPD